MKKVNLYPLFLIFILFISFPFSVSAENAVYVWAKQMEGSYSYGYAVAIDDSGNLYSTGEFYDTVDFDPGAGTANLTSAGGSDIFISKLDSSGNYVWAKQFEGISSGGSVSSSLDSDGNVYVTGYFAGTVDFDPGAGTVNLTSAGGQDIFVVKLDGDGNYVWAKQMGGTGGDKAASSVIDSDGNVYVTGYFAGTVDFDPGAGTVNLTSAGGQDIFVVKLDGDGNYVWAKQMGGTSQENSEFISLDSSNNVYTTGSFQGTADFDPGAGTVNLTPAGGSNSDIFISKLDSSGNYVWAKQIGGTQQDYASSIALDSNNNVYTTGGFNDTVDFDPGAGTANLTSAGGRSVFVSKLDNDGNYVWAKQIGGSGGGNDGDSIATDSDNNVFIMGNFQDTVDFDPGAGTVNLTSDGSYDVFISKLDSDGNYVWAKKIGGAEYDLLYYGTIDSNNNIYTTGFFAGTVDFDPGAGTVNLTSTEGKDNAFISKLTTNNPIPTTTSISPAEKTAGDVQFTLTVTGTNFITDSVVRWNETSLATTYVSGTELTAIVSNSNLATAGTVEVTVFNPTPGGGISNTQIFTIDNIIPTLTSITPTSATAETAQFTITATGTDFISTSVINWNGTPLTTTYVSGTELTAVVPSANLLVAGAVNVTVTNPTPGGGTTDPQTFTIAPAPVSSSGSRPKSIPTITPPTTETICPLGHLFSTTTGLPCTQNQSLQLGTGQATPPLSCLITLTLRQGYRGEQVKCLQSKLNLTQDGIFGPLTKNAVILFQQNHNLTPDGVVGPKTRGEMN